MQVKNVSAQGSLTIAATGQQVAPGETAEVPDALGESLCQQEDNWQATTTKAARSGKEN